MDKIIENLKKEGSREVKKSETTSNSLVSAQCGGGGGACACACR
jgi:hypothetical protein